MHCEHINKSLIQKQSCCTFESCAILLPRNVRGEKIIRPSPALLQKVRLPYLKPKENTLLHF